MDLDSPRLPDRPKRPERRRLLAALSACGTAALTPAWAQGSTAPDTGSRSVEGMVGPIVGQARVLKTGIRLELPGLADNGHLVPLRVTVDSPMTEQDHVREILLLSSRNPAMRMATFSLGPWSGRAELATRVRLAGTQVVVALAALSNGEFRVAQAQVIVTESACLDMG